MAAPAMDLALIVAISDTDPELLRSLLRPLRDELPTEEGSSSFPIHWNVSAETLAAGDQARELVIEGRAAGDDIILPAGRTGKPHAFLSAKEIEAELEFQLPSNLRTAAKPTPGVEALRMPFAPEPFRTELRQIYERSSVCVLAGANDQLEIVRTQGRAAVSCVNAGEVRVSRTRSGDVREGAVERAYRKMLRRLRRNTDRICVFLHLSSPDGATRLSCLLKALERLNRHIEPRPLSEMLETAVEPSELIPIVHLACVGERPLGGNNAGTARTAETSRRAQREIIASMSGRAAIAEGDTQVVFENAKLSGIGPSGGELRKLAEASCYEALSGRHCFDGGAAFSFESDSSWGLRLRHQLAVCDDAPAGRLDADCFFVDREHWFAMDLSVLHPGLSEKDVLLDASVWNIPLGVSEVGAGLAVRACYRDGERYELSCIPQGGRRTWVLGGAAFRLAAGSSVLSLAFVDLDGRNGELGRISCVLEDGLCRWSFTPIFSTAEVSGPALAGRHSRIGLLASALDLDPERGLEISPALRREFA